MHPVSSPFQKIHQKLKSNPDIYPTLQSIVLHEVETEVSQVRNSATEALLWLRRGLKFLKEFLSEVNAGQQDIQEALSKCHHCSTPVHLGGEALTHCFLMRVVFSCEQTPPTDGPSGSTTGGSCVEFSL